MEGMIRRKTGRMRLERSGRPNAGIASTAPAIAMTTISVPATGNDNGTANWRAIANAASAAVHDTPPAPM
jgi:hypothetical protein